MTPSKAKPAAKPAPPPATEEQRTLILTGASRGIGHATVKRFSSAGWRVITCSRHPFPENCPWAAGPEDHIQVDLANADDTARAVAEMRTRLEGGKLHADLGRGTVVTLPAAETERRWKQTTPQWPIMHPVLDGITRDQMMARHKSNHIQVVYVPHAKQAHRACRIKAAMLSELGLDVHFCGNVETA